MVDQNIKDAFLKLSLRMIPFFPANELHDLIVSLRQSREDVDRQVRDAVESLRKSSQLVHELEKTLTERTRKLSELQAEYNKYSKLSEITQEQADALIRQISSELGNSAKRERMVSFIINIIAGAIIFVLGVLFAAPINRMTVGLFH